MAHAVTAALNDRQAPQSVQFLLDPLCEEFDLLPGLDGGGERTPPIAEFVQQLGGTSVRGMTLDATVWGYGRCARDGASPSSRFEVPEGQAVAQYHATDRAVALGNPLADPMPAHRLPGDYAEYRSDRLPDAWNASARGGAGFHVLRDANENSLRNSGVLPSEFYEVPVIIRDCMFAVEGELSGLPGDAAVVNGNAWPRLDVEPRKYRLRMLNGSESRFCDVRFEAFASEDRVRPGEGTQVPMMVIGNDLGLLDAPAVPELTGRSGVPAAPGVLPIGPGERYDLIVDFTDLPAGSRVAVTDTARSRYPDAAGQEGDLAGRLMAFDVVLPLNPAVPDATVQIGTNLRPIAGPLPLSGSQDVPVRRILLFDGTDAVGRKQTMVGPVDADLFTGLQGTLTARDPITERPGAGTTEIWEFFSTAAEARPMQLHLAEFRILDRQAFAGELTPRVNTDGSMGAILNPASIVRTGAAMPAGAWEAGRKDTVKLLPGEVTRLLVSFHCAGEHVYHGRILSHEDRETMRPYEVT